MSFRLLFRNIVASSLIIGLAFLTPKLQSQELGEVGTVQGTGDLTESASWDAPDAKQVREAFRDWLSESNASPETADRLDEFLANEFQCGSGVEIVDLVIDGIVIARPDVNQLRDKLRRQRSGSRAPDFSQLLDNSDEQDFLRDHVRIFFARWLAQNEFYDESLEHFAKVDLDEVLDPATLLFYRGLMEHQLLKKDDCLKTMARLLENPKDLPRRYAVLARLMVADMQPLEADSLDEVSRIMNDIRRRTGLFRSGKLVLDQEEQVIKKLDKLIEVLEAQQRSRQAGNNVAPSSPMQDSFKARGKGTGEATSRRLTDGGDWGDLPPADRASALAELAKEMPPHYRTVIEEYFRQLAREKGR